MLKEFIGQHTSKNVSQENCLQHISLP